MHLILWLITTTSKMLIILRVVLYRVIIFEINICILTLKLIEHLLGSRLLHHGTALVRLRDRIEARTIL